MAAGCGRDDAPEDDAPEDDAPEDDAPEDDAPEDDAEDDAMISSPPMSGRPRWSITALAVALAIAVGLSACGPFVYVSEVSRHAADSVDAARAAQADKYAPYWWTRATQYLQKAREVGAHADFQGANRFGQLAAEAADRATQEALVAARDPSKRPLDLPPDVAPATEPQPPAKPPAAPAKDGR
jgi:Domain of unknown function (DUF4398)